MHARPGRQAEHGIELIGEELIGAVPGELVDTTRQLFTLADLSTVWIEADIFESDISFIRTGQAAKITTPNVANTGFQGTVNFLQPAVDPQQLLTVAPFLRSCFPD